MRNCIFFKVLAILLCAASLAGMIGGTAGILTLVEHDLYNKTVQEVITQKVERHAAEFATQASYRYADQVLGGCPDEIARSGNSNILSQNYDFYGYSILDAEGNVLESLNPELKSHTQTYSSGVTGQYMHLVSLQTESQAMEEEARKRLNAYGDVMADNNGDTVPEEGISIHHVIFTDRDGNVLYEAVCNGLTGSSAYYYRDYLLDNGTVDSFAHGYPDHMSSRTGFLFYNSNRQLIYTSILEENEKAFQATVYGVTFHNENQNFTFQAENPDGLGTIVNEGGCLMFSTFPEPQEETVAETVPATVPEETQPEETAAETQPEETVAETEAAPPAEETAPAEDSYEEDSDEDSEEYYEESSASDVPEEGGEEQWSEESAEVSEEAPQEEPQEVPQETVSQEPQPTEPPAEKVDYSHLAEPARTRIYYEWLLSQGLIQQSEFPAGLITEEDLHNWLVFSGMTGEEEPGTEIPQKATSSQLVNGKTLDNYQVNQLEYRNRNTGELTTAKYVYLPMPELTVEVYVSPASMTDSAVYTALGILREFRSYLLPAIGICLLLFIFTAIYLYNAAGRSPKAEEIQARGINRLPLDLYLILGFAFGIGILALAGVGVPILLNSDLMLGCCLAVSAAFLCCMMVIGFFFAAVAQSKTGGGFWWRQTLSSRLISLFVRYAKIFSIWLKDKALPALLRFAKKAGQVTLNSLRRIHAGTQKLLFRIGKAMDRFFSLIPMTWQWMVCGIGLLCLLLIACNSHNILLTLICLAASLGIVLYGTHCFGILLDSTRKMGKGNLETKVEDRLMVGCFWDFARELNNLAGVANVAAQKQLKSERLKTELITNVSHDIKTPLTSIINYVDLLQKPHTTEEEVQYLEVLDRQSQRLKKLVEDLMDMSKASTGNMDVEITTVDIVESVNQALGEFSDKLEYAQLQPVFRHTEDSVPVIADGELVWRVLGNLLSNVVKYAMPKTRIYLDLTRMNGKVILSMKNISREPLNIDAEELMDRFVRGDVSRNTEGSGLGLNIAQSLMELQNGQLQMLVDGDLFKVTLIFPDGR